MKRSLEAALTRSAILQWKSLLQRKHAVGDLSHNTSGCLPVLLHILIVSNNECDIHSVSG